MDEQTKKIVDGKKIAEQLCEAVQIKQQNSGVGGVKLSQQEQNQLKTYIAKLNQFILDCEAVLDEDNTVVNDLAKLKKDLKDLQREYNHFWQDIKLLVRSAVNNVASFFTKLANICTRLVSLREFFDTAQFQSEQILIARQSQQLMQKEEQKKRLEIMIKEKEKEIQRDNKMRNRMIAHCDEFIKNQLPAIIKFINKRFVLQQP